MAQESRLSIVIDSRNAEQKAKDLEGALAAMDAAGIRLVSTSRKAGTSLSGLGGQSIQGAAGVDRLSRSLSSAEKQAASTAATINRMLKAALAGFSAMHIIDVADEWGQYASRMKMATQSADEYEHAQSRMAKSAQATYRNINETRESFIQLSPVLRDMGLSLDQSIDAVDAFSGLLVVNGANAERGAAAMAALSKSFQRGRVDAQAWMTIYSTADSIIEHLVASSEKSAEEIRQLGVDGKISAEMMAKALVTAYGPVLKQVEGMPTTVRDALTNLNTAFGEYIGGANESSQVTAKLAKGIDLLGDNFSMVADVVGVGVAGALVVYTSRTIEGVRASVAMRLESVKKATAYAEEAAFANKAAQSAKHLAAADLERAHAAVASAEAKVAAERVAQSENLMRLKSAQELMAAENALEVQRLKAQITDKGRQMAATRMAEIRLAEVAIAKQVEAAEKSLAATSIATSAVVQKAYADRSAAAGAYAVAAKAANATAVNAERAAASASLMSRAGAGLLALLGGPVGLVSTIGIAAASFLVFRNNADEAAMGTDTLGLSVDQLRERMASMSKQQAEAELTKLRVEARKVNGEIDVTQQKIDFLADRLARFPSAPSADSWRDQLSILRGSAEDLRAKMQGLNGQMAEFFKFISTTVDAGALEDALPEVVTKQLAQLDKQIALFGKAGQAAQYYYELEKGALKDLEPEHKARIKASVDILAGQEKEEEARRKAAASTAKQEKEAARLLKTLQDQVSVLGLSDKEMMKYQLRVAGATDAQLKAADSLFETKIAFEKTKAAQEAYKSLMLDLRTEEERTNDQFRERIKVLREAGLSAEQYQASLNKLVASNISVAPKFDGLDASVGGASGELIRVAQARAELEQWRAKELEQKAAYFQTVEGMEEQHAAAILEINRRYNEQQMNLSDAWRSATLANFAFVTGDAAAMLRGLGHEGSLAYKAMFIASKAAGIAQAIINTEISATRARAELGPALGIPMAEKMRALGYASVGIMAATSLTGMAHSGIDQIPREGTWLLDKGERVLSPRQNSDLTSYLKQANTAPAGAGGGQPVQINVEVHIASDGTAQTQVDGAGAQQGRQLGEMIAGQVQQALAREMRQGGLLWNQRNGYTR